MYAWKCDICKIKQKTLSRAYPPMHWCKKATGKYLPMKEVTDAD